MTYKDVKLYTWDKKMREKLYYTQELLYDYNTLRPSKTEERNQIIRKIFKRVGNKFTIRPPFYCYFGSNISIGDNFYANFNCIILDHTDITFGNNVLLGPNVSFFLAGHPLHPEPRIIGSNYAVPITIGNTVWIGGGAIINPGVTIGDNSVIGSGSVVTKDIPANVLAVGNPCRVIREITDDDIQYYYKNLKYEPFYLESCRNRIR